jgi:LuxR family maltose regulon positive regulatory protein
MHLPLSPEDVETLESRTEGWITGLQLAAVAALSSGQTPTHLLRQARLDPEGSEAFVASFAGDNRYVLDYLVEEVLQGQPKATRRFLRQTAIVDRLTASLCDALTDGRDSQTVLEQLEEANLFVIPIDHRREWYRYHRLFAEALRTMLDIQEQTDLHQRAAHWYEKHGYTNQAIKHALARASVSGEWVEAERLIRRTADASIHAGSLMTVAGWLDALPAERVHASGELATYKGWVLVLTGEIDPADDYARVAEKCLRASGKSDGSLGRLLVLRAFIAVFGQQDYGSAVELAADALQLLDEDQTHWRAIALWAMAESQERTANITEAIATLRRANSSRHALDEMVFSATVELFLATALYLHGQRREAVSVCTEAIERHTDEAGQLSPVAGMITSWLGMLYYEANDLEQARVYLEQGLALCQRIGLEAALLFAYGCLAPMLWAQGDRDGALAALDKAREFAARSGLTEADPFLAREVNMRLRQGDLSFGQRWAQRLELSPDSEPDYLGIERHVAYARLLLAQGRLPDAQHWLAQLESFTQERGLDRWLLTVRILQSLTFAGLGDRSSALDRLSQAVQIAAPEDFFRAFLEEDERVLGLVPGVREVAPAFVDQLMIFAGIHRSDPEPAIQGLIEPLSKRELEVLVLIAGGFSNREIAQKLFIAQGTVKRHINNIYGKMDVRSRTQAVARARELDLL